MSDAVHQVTHVFKSGDSTSKSEFTKKWIEAVNRIEREKSMTSGRQDGTGHPALVEMEHGSGLSYF